MKPKGFPFQKSAPITFGKGNLFYRALRLSEKETVEMQRRILEHNRRLDEMTAAAFGAPLGGAIGLGRQNIEDALSMTAWPSKLAAKQAEEIDQRRLNQEKVRQFAHLILTGGRQ